MTGQEYTFWVWVLVLIVAGIIGSIIIGANSD
jgi:hypothetical protein